MANTKVTTGVIKDDAVGADQLASNSVVTASIVDNAITTAKINNDAILTAKISNSAITNAKMSANSVDSDQYVDASIDTAHIRDGQITSAKLDTNISVSGELTVGSHLNMGDGDILKMGAGNDLQIYHDGSNSYVKDAGTGNLNLQGENLALENTSGDNYFVGVNGSFVKIYYSGVEKLATTSSGIDVTGTATFSSGFTSNASSTITTADNLETLSLISTDTDANVGPVLGLYRNSASPADNDTLARVSFFGNNDADEKITYAQFAATLKDVTDGTEDASLKIGVTSSGSFNNRLDFLATETVFNEDSKDLDFRVESDVNSHALFVQGSDGYVGIGVSPSAPLHVVGSSLVGVNDFGAYDKDDANLLISNGNNGTSILLHDGSGAYHSSLIKYDTNILSLGLNNSNDANSILTSSALNITSTGVGIGTDSPSNPLHLLSTQTDFSPSFLIKNSSTANGSIASLRFSAGSSATGFFIGKHSEGHGDANAVFINQETDAPMVFSTNGTERMRIDNEGRIKIGTINNNHDAKFNLTGTGDSSTQVFMQNNETYVVGQLIGSAGVSTKTATLVFETNHLRACSIEMETSGHKYNNGGDFWQSRHFYTCMSEGANQRINSRVSNHEFAVGGTDRMTTSLTKTTGSNVWTAVITIQGEYQGNFHFRIKGYGAANCPTSLTIA